MPVEVLDRRVAQRAGGRARGIWTTPSRARRTRNSSPRVGRTQKRFSIASGPSRPISWCWPTTTSGRSSPLLRVSVNCSSWAPQASLRTRCAWGPAPALSSSRSLIIQDTSRVEASTSRTQFVSTGLLDVDEFDSLQAAADLYVSDNLTSGVMAQAAPLGTPVLAMLNTTGASPEAFPSSAPAQQERRKEGASKEWAS